MPDGRCSLGTRYAGAALRDVLSHIARPMVASRHVRHGWTFSSGAWRAVQELPALRRVY
jgi:hypothetical protein